MERYPVSFGIDKFGYITNFGSNLPFFGNYLTAGPSTLSRIV